jgi:TolB-like protein/Flp pilus assembly protein TadD
VKPSKAADQLGPPSVRAQLTRILTSREFAAAERMRRFLTLAVSETLAGRAAALKEYTIAVEAFDRPPSFNPAIDPIVRVEARRLRAKLEKYYRGEGRDDRVVIELPKGSYAPRFRLREAPQPQPESRPATKTIAVLPFRNLGSSPDSAYFSDGLTWELIHRLTRIGGLCVIAWSSAEQARAAGDASAAGAMLKARNVLTGSVRQWNAHLRVTAQLIDSDSGVYLWSETYDRRLEDVFAIQDEIAQAIVSKLSVELGEERSEPQAPRYNVEAYRIYLHARALWNRRTEPDLRKSIELFERAAALDPEFALAYAGVADAHALLADYAQEPPGAAMPAAKTAALRALAIDPTLGEAHCSLAFISSHFERDWNTAEVHYRRALDLNPGYATTHHWFGVDYLAILGRFKEALAEIDIARQLDPLSQIICEGRGLVLMLEGRYDEAVEHYREMIRRDPSFYKAHTGLGRTLLQMGRYEEALENLERGRRIAGDIAYILGAMGQAYGLSGRTEQAREVLEKLSAMAQRRYVPSTCFALVHAGLGEKTAALGWLQRGVDSRELPVVALYTHPAYDSLRDEPVFEDLLRQLGFRGERVLGAARGVEG